MQDIDVEKAKQMYKIADAVRRELGEYQFSTRVYGDDYIKIDTATNHLYVRLNDNSNTTVLSVSMSTNMGFRCYTFRVGRWVGHLEQLNQTVEQNKVAEREEKELIDNLRFAAIDDKLFFDNKPAPDKPAWETALSERRCGFSFGLVAGGMLGAVEGFPNDSEKIDREIYFTETGFAGGGQVSNWFGIAMTDWFTFGLGGHFGTLKSADHDTSFFGGNFHIDVFPLYGLGGSWRELGMNVDAGVSNATTSHVDDPDVGLIESGGASRIAIGAFYEGFRWWKLSTGPFATFDQLWSTSVYRPTAWIGWRTAFYVGPSPNP